MGSTVNILLVDDDEVDVQGLKRAFKKSKIGKPIYSTYINRSI